MTTTAWPGWDGSAGGISPLVWYRLMHRAETIREHYPLGLASVWACINQGDYHRAVEELDRVNAAIASGKIPRRKDGPLGERPPAPIHDRLESVRPLPPSHPDCERCHAGAGEAHD